MPPMARDPMDELLARSLRAEGPARRGPVRLPLPFHHHPVVAVSLILIVASLAQIGVWLVNARLPGPAELRPSCVIAHGLLFDIGREAVAGHQDQADLNQPAVFITCLVISLLSGVAWYGAARLALGPAWGLWTGLCWVAHPSFAFVASRPSPLALMILLIPLIWCMLLWWWRARRPGAALFAGVLLAVLSLVSVQGVILLLVVILAMLLVQNGRSGRWVACAATLVGFTVCLIASLPLTIPRLSERVVETGRYKYERRLTRHLWRALDDGCGSSIAEAAHTQRLQADADGPPTPWALLASESRRSPRDIVHWYAARVWRTLYETADGKLRRPLLSLQLAWLVPALWGYLVAFSHARWRWPAATAGLFIAPTWLLAAFAEPLARSLTPVWGFVIMFALVALADIYERILGRRLRVMEDRGAPQSAV